MSVSEWARQRQVLLEIVLWNVWWSFCGLQTAWEGEEPKTLESCFWVAGPSPSSNALFALSLKGTLTLEFLFGLALLSIFWLLVPLSVSAHEVDVDPEAEHTFPERQYWQQRLLSSSTDDIAVLLSPRSVCGQWSVLGERHGTMSVERLGEMRWVNRPKSLL